MQRYQAPSQDINNEILTMDKLKTGILLQSVMNGITVTLPSGAMVHQTLLGINSSIDWSVICYGINVGSCTISNGASANHGVIGNMYVAAGTSGLLRTRVASLNVATTYRIA